MTIGKINIDETLENAKKLLAEDKCMSSVTKLMIELLLLVIGLLLECLNLDSSNSSKPPLQGSKPQKKS